MFKALARGLVSACLIVLLNSGGGGLSLIDGLIFHSLGRGSEAGLAHFESSSGCHADGCAVRSTAQHTPLALALRADARVSSTPKTRFFLPPFPAQQVEPRSGEPLSRAPPAFG